MKTLIIVIGVMVLACSFGYYSYKCALKDKYIKRGERVVFMRRREFWNPSGASYRSITIAELPSVLIEYWTKGKRQIKEQRDFFNKHLAGRSVNETSALVEAEIKRRINNPSYY